jgi:mannose-6-phosphate isomerase-like protein (cupin superfamily)
MANFYDTWLEYWDKSQEANRTARKAIHEEELEWVSTPQDHSVALLCAPETGFKTSGTETLLAEIPVGCHTGKHVHGEEGIFVIEGEGFTIVKLAGEDGAGRRFDWNKGSTIWIPFGAEHQHFNTGTLPVRYFSFTSLHLERWLGFAKLEQLEKCGKTQAYPNIEVAESPFDSKNRRIVLRWDDADWHGPRGKWSRHVKVGSFMTPEQGFKNFEIQISGILSDDPGKRLGGRHAHMEAILYILEGEGYTIADGERIDWKKGTCLQVQGPQTIHEHFCTGQTLSSMLRCAPGIRNKFGHFTALERFPYLRFNPDGKLLHEIREVNMEEAHTRLGA